MWKLAASNPAKPVSLTDAYTQEPKLRAEIDGDEQLKTMFNIAVQLEGLYRHASTHAAGIVISEKPLSEVVPLYRDPRSDIPATQFSKDFVEGVGLVKFDFLGLKTLTIIQKAVELINEKLLTDGKIDIDHIPLDDENALNLFRKANTHGVFQFESLGVQRWLKSLSPISVNDIIALTALYRPGPMDNIPDYVERRWQRTKPVYPHPSTIPILEETYGVAVYQEQVMRIAQVVAGFSLGAADNLRRIISKGTDRKKKNAALEAVHKEFSKGAIKTHNMAEADIDELFNTLGKFAGYGFNKSHAAAYGIVAYQTGWIKANYPIAFFIAAMTQELNMGSTDTLAGYVSDAKRNQINVLPVDVNHPALQFSMETIIQDGKEGLAIRYTLLALKGVNLQGIKAIEAAHKEGGDFSDIFDFLERVPQFSGFKRVFEILIYAGAFDGIAPNRALLIHNMEALLVYAQDADNNRNEGGGLFGDAMIRENRPQLKPIPEWDSALRLAEEARVVGFYLSGHPLDSYEIGLNRLGITPCKKIENGEVKTGEQVKLAGVITRIKHNKFERKPREGEKPKSATPEMITMTIINFSDASGNFEIALYENRFQEYENLLQVGRLLYVQAKLVQIQRKTDDRDDRPPNDTTHHSENPADFSQQPAQDDNITKNRQSDNDGLRLRLLWLEDLPSLVGKTAEGANIYIDIIPDREKLTLLQHIIKQNSASGAGKIRISIHPEGANGDGYDCLLPDGYVFSPDFKPAIQAQLGYQVDIV